MGISGRNAPQEQKDSYMLRVELIRVRVRSDLLKVLEDGKFLDVEDVRAEYFAPECGR